MVTGRMKLYLVGICRKDPGPSLESSSSQRRCPLLGTQYSGQRLVVRHKSKLTAVEVGVKVLYSVDKGKSLLLYLGVISLAA